jgi:hypothetical protein
MEIPKEIYLTQEEIETMIRSIFPNEKAAVITKKLLSIMFINKKDNKMYMLQPNITYESFDKIDDKLIKYVTLLLELSFKDLPSEGRDLIKERYAKSYAKIFQNADVDKYITQLKTDLIKEVTFDDYKDEVHFRNGVFDLKTCTLRKRDVKTHFITKTISYDYSPSNLESRNKIKGIINKIYPKKEDKECMFFEFAVCITGRATEQQNTLFLLGDGSTGKSTIMELNLATYECYVHELKEDTFSQSNSAVSKILCEFILKTYIRMCWLNEPKDEKMNDTMFKNFCDGKVFLTELYKDGQKTVTIQCKGVICANTNPNIKIDGGTTRRIEGFTHTSKFVKSQKEVDEKKNIYLGDEKLKDRFKSDINLKLAWFDIIAKYCKKYYEGEKIKYSQNFEDTRSIIINSNDVIKDFVDANLKITNDQTHRIGKNTMHKRFSEKYPNKHLTVAQIITSLKEKKIQYDPKLRADLIQGCFTGVKFNDSDDEEDYDIPIDKQIESTKNQIYGLEQLLIVLQQKQKDEKKGKVVENIPELEPEPQFEDEEEVPKKKPKKVKVVEDKLLQRQIEKELINSKKVQAVFDKKDSESKGKKEKVIEYSALDEINFDNLRKEFNA